MNTFVKTWQERLVNNRAYTAMQSEIADLRIALAELQQEFDKQAKDSKDLLLANKLAYTDLSNCYDELLDELRCQQERYT